MGYNPASQVGTRSRLEIEDMPLELNPRDLKDAVRAYAAGESEQSIARRLGVARATLRKRLIAAGVSLRGRGDAMTVRMGRASPEERQRLVAAAHKARRGARDPLERLELRARSAERTVHKQGPYERRLIELLADSRLPIIPQKAVGKYNLDLAIGSVAVEVHTATNHPFKRLDLRERTNYLTDRGWDVLYVWVGHGVITKDTAHHVVAFVQEAERQPSARRQYRVIRCSGEVVTSGRGHLDEFA